MTGGSTSASGISIGWSTGTKDITDLLIQNNVISDIDADTTPWTSHGSGSWTRGYGAYGILINHGANGTGQVPTPQILNNTISDLEGLWAHGIGLEGDTPGAQVTGNVIDDLTDNKGGTDAIGIYAEDNSGAGSVQIHNNKLTSMTIGVALNPTTATGVMDATNNWWGDATGPYNANANPAGLGSAVWPSVDDSQPSYVDFSPFYNSSAMDTLVSVDPIASFDLAFNPTSQTVGGSSTLTVTAKDAGGYVVVNDSLTQVNLSVSSGTATLTDSSITMEADGDTTTTITSNTIGAATVFAADSDNYSANGYGTITFTAGADITAPVITNIQVINIGTDTAIVTWDTDEWATSQVEYGTTSGYDTLTAVDSTMNINHSVTLTGLSSGTVYHFRVISLDNNSNVATSGDNLFTTVGVDTTPPVITLLGQNPITLTVGDTFTDPGATANDNEDGNITPIVIGGDTVDTSIAGIYVITYNVSDTASNPAVEATRTVIVVDPAVAPITPTVTLNGVPIVSSYTATEAGIRFASGLEFDTTNIASFTINGSSVATSTTVTAKTMSEATALGLHVYNVVVTSSTGDTANITVAYNVTADFDDTATLGVTGITASSTTAIADNTWENGWSWIFNVTVPTSETAFSMKFLDFTNSDGTDTIPAANNLRFYTTQSSDSYSTSTATMITASSTYSTAIDLNADLQPTIPGMQIEVVVEMKVPTSSTGGSYSSQYAVKSENI